MQVNVPLIHQVVVAQLAAARQGTHDHQDPRRGPRRWPKPYRQKGTGRARQGSTRAPQFAGGGVVHGPTPRDYAPAHAEEDEGRRPARRPSDRARDGRVHVVDRAVDGDAPSTKTAVGIARAAIASASTCSSSLERDRRASPGRACATSTRSTCSSPDQLNTYDVLVSDDVVFTEGALQAFLAGPPKGKPARRRSRRAARPPDAVEPGRRRAE